MENIKIQQIVVITLNLLISSACIAMEQAEKKQSPLQKFKIKFEKSKEEKKEIKQYLKMDNSITNDLEEANTITDDINHLLDRLGIEITWSDDLEKKREIKVKLNELRNQFNWHSNANNKLQSILLLKKINAMTYTSSERDLLEQAFKQTQNNDLKCEQFLQLWIMKQKEL
jgi:hypothetical protein